MTDFIDGEIARRYGIVTNFGKLMDPLVDKIMMAAAFISLVPLKVDAGLGGDDSCGARFFDYRFAIDGEREGPGPARGMARKTENFVAGGHRHFFSRSYCRCKRAAIPE